MINAFILIGLNRKANSSEVARIISEMDGVDNLHLVSGGWDIILRAKVEDMPKLRKITVDKILTIPGVSKTNTLVVANEE